MKLFLFKNRISGLALAIFLAIVLVLGMFLISTQNRKQQMLEQQGFRVLNSLGASMKEKDDVISRVVENIDPSSQRVGDSKNGKRNTNKNNKNESFKKPNRQTINSPDSIKDTIERFKNKQIGNRFLSEKLKITFSSNPGTGDSLYYLGRKDSVFFCTMSLNDFVSPLLRKDFFSNYIVISDEKIVFNSFPGDMALAPMGISNNLQKAPGFNLQIFNRDQRQDTTQKLQFALQSGGIEKVTIAGKDYLLFIQPVNFHAKKNRSYIGGFVEQKMFLGWKRSLPSYVIVIFVVILLFITFSFPVWKVFVSGPMERLTKTGVAMIGVALMAGTLLLVVLFSEILIRHNIKVSYDNNLKVINKQITRSFNDETDLILKQLISYDSVRAADNKAIRSNESGSYSPDNFVIKSLLDDTIHTKYNHPCYKFFKSVFWADEAGEQIMLYTPYRGAPLTNVAYREYFQHPDKYTRIIEKDTVWYGMETVYSNNTGNWLIAYSIYSHDCFITGDAANKPVNKKTVNKTPAKAKIIALTSPVYSLKNPVLPHDYEFCLVDKTGKVWYHSEEVLNLTDNFITESNNDKNLTDALNSEKSNYISGTFHHQGYRMFFSPLKGTDLFIVTLFNPNGVNAIEVNTTFFIIGFFTILFIIIVILYFLTKVVTIKIFKQKRYSYFLSCLIPDKTKIRGYHLLSWINYSLIATLIILSFIDKFFRIQTNFFILGFTVFLIAHSIFIFWVLSRWREKNDNHTNISENKCFSRYTLFVISWLLTVVVAPPIIITNRVYQEEAKQYLVSQQACLASKINERTDRFHQFYKENIPTINGYELSIIRNNKGLYFDSVFDLKLLTANNDKFDSALINFKGLKASKSGSSLRSGFSGIMEEPAKIAINPLTEGISFPYGDSLNVLKFNRLSYEFPDGKSISKAYFQSNLHKLAIFHRFYCNHTFSFLFWFAILLMMFGFYFLIRNILKRLFSIDELNCKPDSFRDLFLSLQNTNQNAVLVSMHVPEKEEMIGWSFIDLSASGVKLKKYLRERIILCNFESGIDGGKIFKKRIRKLEKYLSYKPSVLLLHKTPSQLIEQYSEEFKTLKKINKLSALLHRFEKSVLGVPVVYAIHSASDGEEKTTCPYMNAILKEERKFNPGINAVEPILRMNFPSCWDPENNYCQCKHASGGNCNMEIEVIRNIHELSFSYCKYIWESLSEEEQFVLLDLAPDALVNRKNHEWLKLLIKKGIIEIKEDIRIISPAFRRFVLTSVDISGFEGTQKKLSYESNWHRLKVPLILIATSILVLLVITQQNFLSNINTILVSVAAIIGVYLKISGFFSPSKPS